MAKIRRCPIRLAARWEKHGMQNWRGQDYEPFLRVWDVPSRGLRRRLRSWSVERVHHLLSQHEIRAFYLLDVNPSVTDIREQFPLLPVSEVESIAASLGVKYTKNNIKHVYTTDLLVTIDGADVAISIKPSEELKKKRTIEKLIIEREYWARRDIRFYIVTELDVDDRLAKSIALYHRFRGYPAPLESEQSKSIAADIYLLTKTTHSSVATVCKQIDEQRELQPGTCMSLVKIFLANDLWALEPGTYLSPDQPLTLSKGGECLIA